MEIIDWIEHKVGVLAGQGFATWDIFKIIEEENK